MTIEINNVIVVNTDRSFTTGSGTVRPASPLIGMIWYNTSLSQYEYYDGTEWKPVIKSGTGRVLFGWGLNTNGKIGDGTTSNRSSPVGVIGGLTNWIQVSAGYKHSTALRSNGTAWTWGYNNFGQLGDGTITSRRSPGSVVGGFTDWVQISAGGYFSSAIRGNGTIWSWGSNSLGQLGDNTSVDKSSPISLTGGYSNWTQVSAGRNHTLGIRTNGTAWGWGFAQHGRLGTGDIGNFGISSPKIVRGGFSDWTQVSAGNAHSAAIRANGTAWCWGYNFQGELGDNTTSSRSSPVSVVGGFTDWIQVSAGDNHTAGIRTNGTVWSWGRNTSGQLGDNTTVGKSSPVSVVGGFTDWIHVETGNLFSLALRSNGTAWAWGSSFGGALGNGVGGDFQYQSPVSVVGGFTDWVQISTTRGRHSLAIR